MHSIIKDISLAPQGAHNVAWAQAHMAPLMAVRARFAKEKPFKGLRIGMALHLTKETAVLVETLCAGGAEVAIASCNPLSTQDDVAAYLAKKGAAAGGKEPGRGGGTPTAKRGGAISVFGYKGETNADYYKFINAVVAAKPHITIDDGCDLVSEIHLHHKKLIPQILGGCEETTTGIQRLKAMMKDHALKYPVVAVNDNLTKHLFDNFYGTGQSTWDGILRATNILVAGKTVVVAGYGDCGRGIALRGRGLGAHVIVTEINPVRALQARMDGYEVTTMDNASARGDVFITATGNRDVITPFHMKKMKSGAILANSGHFNVEIDVDGLTALAEKVETIRPGTQAFTLRDGATSGANPPQGKGATATTTATSTRASTKTLYLLGEGRLVNLAAAEGHPSEVMALSFCGQALACEWIVKNKPKAGLYTLPSSIDDEIAHLALATLDIKIDELTKAQQAYIASWNQGT